MCTLPFNGLPQTVITLLDCQTQKEDTRLKTKIIIDGEFVQVTLTWLPVRAEYRKDTLKPIHYRKKTPSEIRRDRKRKEEYLNSKQRSYDDTCKNYDKSVTNDNMQSVKKCGPVFEHQKSNMVITRSKSKDTEMEVPRNNESLDEHFISPQKCETSFVDSSSDSFSEQPLVTNTDSSAISSSPGVMCEPVHDIVKSGIVDPLTGTASVCVPSDTEEPASCLQTLESTCCDTDISQDSESDSVCEDACNNVRGQIDKAWIREFKIDIDRQHEELMRIIANASWNKNT